MTTDQTAYWSQVARRYDRVADRQLGGRTRSLARERLRHEGPLGSVVELGCGSGFFTSVLAEKAESVLATDAATEMLALAREHVKARNVSFQREDCQNTSLPSGAFDTALMSLVLHFTDPDRALAEVRRILKPGGLLIVINLDPLSLTGLDRLRSQTRVVFFGILGYRAKPPRGFGSAVLTETQLRDRLEKCGFEAVGSTPVHDRSRSSNVPVQYVRAIRS